MEDEVELAIGINPLTKLKQTRTSNRGKAGKRAPTKKQLANKHKALGLSEISKIVELSVKGLSQDDISAATGRSQYSVHNVLKKLGISQDTETEIKEYASARDIILTATEKKLIQSINNDSKHRAASLRDCAYAFKEIYQAGRLEKGLSTSNSQQLRFTVEAASLDMQPPSIIELSPTDNNSYEKLEPSSPLSPEEKEQTTQLADNLPGGGD